MLLSTAVHIQRHIQITRLIIRDCILGPGRFLSSSLKSDYLESKLEIETISRRRILLTCSHGNVGQAIILHGDRCDSESRSVAVLECRNSASTNSIIACDVSDSPSIALMPVVLRPYLRIIEAGDNPKLFLNRFTCQRKLRGLNPRIVILCDILAIVRSSGCAHALGG